MLRTIIGLALVASVAGNDIEIHGSGTTNPSKCYWNIFDKFMDRLRVPVRMSYRAVGSGVGIKEFMGEAPEFMQINHFGSGDIPFSTEKYNLITQGDNPMEMMHLPVVLGAITMFHSIPGVPSGKLGLNMTSCLLARIYSRDIVDWLDEDITGINPELESLMGDADSKITVIRRKKGSSSTASITKYLNAGCSGEWPSDMVGKGDLDWHEDTIACEGSGGVTTCINNNPGAIGYLDSGHGVSQGLTEIELKNADGHYVSSKSSKKHGGIGSAAANAVGLPGHPGDDFGKIDLINQKGRWTWPVTAMSYIYIKKDWTKMELSKEQQGLLYAFLSSLYKPEFITTCEDLFGFDAAYKNEDLLKLATTGLDEIITVEGAKELFTFEFSTDEYQGHGDYVISSKRRTYAEYERSQLQLQVDGLTRKNKRMETEAANARAASALEAQNAEGFTSSDKSQIMIALIMSGVALVLAALLTAKVFCCAAPAKQEAAGSRSAPPATSFSAGKRTTKSRKEQAIGSASDEENMV